MVAMVGVREIIKPTHHYTKRNIRYRSDLRRLMGCNVRVAAVASQSTMQDSLKLPEIVDYIPMQSDTLSGLEQKLRQSKGEGLIR